MRTIACGLSFLSIGHIACVFVGMVEGEKSAWIWNVFFAVASHMQEHNGAEDTSRYVRGTRSMGMDVEKKKSVAGLLRL